MTHAHYRRAVGLRSEDFPCGSEAFGTRDLAGFVTKWRLSAELSSSVKCRVNVSLLRKNRSDDARAPLSSPPNTYLRSSAMPCASVAEENNLSCKATQPAKPDHYSVIAFLTIALSSGVKLDYRLRQLTALCNKVDGVIVEYLTKS